MLLTEQKYTELYTIASADIRKVAHEINFRPTCIADIGGNVGYYTRAMYSLWPEAKYHVFEPIKQNIEAFLRLNHDLLIKSDRIIHHPYALTTEDSFVEMYMRDDNRENNGTYSIIPTTNTKSITRVETRNINNFVYIQPDFVKIDVEGSELIILQCEDFFANTKAILIECVYKDDWGQNELIYKQLQKMNFKFQKQISKNDQLWIIVNQ